ncbi:hypothetical protein D3C84_398490 [compost metagenome]
MRSRAWSVDINGAPYIGLQSGSTQFRCQFNIDVSPQSAVSFADIRLYNLSKESGITQGSSIIFKAGYTDNIGAIFTGSVTNILREREPGSTEIITRLICRSGAAVTDRGSANLSFGAGVRVQEIIRALARAWPLPIDIDDAQFADDIPMARGYMVSGDIPKAMDNLAYAYKFNWLQHMGRMYVTKPEMKRKQTALQINQLSGMIGIPEVTRGPKGLGVFVSVQLNPSIMINSVIDLKSEFATYNTGNLFVSEVGEEAIARGEYSVLALKYSGDSHSDQWKVDIDGLREGTKPDTTAVPTPENGKLIWGAVVEQDFRDKVRQIAKNLSLDPNWLMAVMAFETGPKERFKPNVTNPKSSAIGLIQFIKSTARGLGTTTEHLGRMSAVQQLDYVEKYYKAYWRRIHNLGDAYLAVLWPGGMEKPDTYVMWEKDSGPYQREYAANKGLDKNKDGKITRGEAVAAVNSAYQDGLKHQR